MTAKQPYDVLGGDGKVRVLSRRCGTCLFRPGHPFGEDRAAEVIETNIACGALLTCHSTLPYGPHPGFGPAVCAGFWAKHAMQTAAGRLARFVLGVTRIKPPHKYTPDPCGTCGDLPGDPPCGGCTDPGCPCSEMTAAEAAGEE